MQIFGEETEQSAVTLPRYAQLIGYSECAFFGISSTGNDNFECRELWLQSQREEIAMYLHEAQVDLEQILNYPIGLQWFADERHSYRYKILTKFGKVIASGVKTTTVISNAATVDLTVDPCHIHINPSTVSSDFDEVRIYYPGTAIEIVPSNITWAAGTGLLIEIPKCRLIAEAYWVNPSSGWLYTDNTHFLASIDVKRVYNDPLTQAHLVYKNDAVDFDQELYTDTGQYIINPAIGEMQIETQFAGCCKNYYQVGVNYCAGLVPVPRATENAIIRLAHSKMATEPCGCDVTQRLWKRDRNIPQVLTRERINCPFGLSDGAWYAWKWACNNELVRASPLIGRRDFA